MLTFVILEQEGMEMAVGKPIALHQAIDILGKKNKQSQELNLSMYCRYQLVYEEGTVYESSITFPVEPFDLLAHIEEDMSEMNSGNLNQEMRDFLDFLVPFFPKNKEEKREVQTKTQPKKEVIAKAEKPVKVRKSLNKKIIKRVVISLVSLMVLGLVVFAGICTLGKVETPNEVTFESLIQEHQYLEAGKQYPKKIEMIESLLNEQAITKKDQESLSNLQDFNTNYPTTQGAFDIAIVLSDYKEAIKVYEKNVDEFKTSNERLVLVGYCYLKENNVDKAKELAKQTASVELEKKIFEYNQLSIEIEELENQLGELEKGGSKNKFKAEEIAQKKFDLMEKRLNL